jgi:hypothetical protein
MFAPIATAPKDGTHIQAVIPNYGSDNVIAWKQGFADEEGGDCGCWCFISEQEPPSCWTDGVCWESNEDGVASIQPTQWKKLTEE